MPFLIAGHAFADTRYSVSLRTPGTTSTCMDEVSRVPGVFDVEPIFSIPEAPVEGFYFTVGVTNVAQTVAALPCVGGVYADNGQVVRPQPIPTTPVGLWIQVQTFTYWGGTPFAVPAQINISTFPQFVRTVAIKTPSGCLQTNVRVAPAQAVATFRTSSGDEFGSHYDYYSVNGAFGGVISLIQLDLLGPAGAVCSGEVWVR